MSIVLCILWAVLGGLWRRAMGGWLGLPRSVCYGIMAPLALPIGLLVGGVTFCPYGVLAAICMVAVSLLFFVVSLCPGAPFTNANVFKKYGPFGAGYWLARLYWPDNWRAGGFIDGWTSVGEVFLGASFWGCVGLCWSWVL